MKRIALGVVLFASTAAAQTVVQADRIRLNTGTELQVQTSARAAAPLQALSLKLLETGASPQYFSIFTTGDQAGDITYVLPVNDGDSGQTLVTDGSGTLSWSTVAAPEADTLATVTARGATSATLITLDNGATSAGRIALKEDSDNGTNTTTLKGADSVADITVTLPDFTSTLVAGSQDTPTTTDATAEVVIATTTATQTPLVVQGAAAQSVPLQEWQTSAGAVVASVDQDGTLTALDAAIGGGYGSTGVTISDAGAISADGVLTIGAQASPIVLEGATADDYETTIALHDPTADREIQIPDYSGIAWVTGERFNRPHLLVSTSWASWCAATDTSTCYLIGSAMGPITYREEQNKSVRSWVESATGLDISADDTVADEGVEILLADGVGLTLGDGWLTTGTRGGCFEVTFSNVNISATDQFVCGWRVTAAFDGANNPENYAEWSAVGILGTTDGSIYSVGEVAGAGTLTDDSGTNILDGTTHTLKSCINASTRVPTAFLDGVAITMTNSGTAKTASTNMAPFCSYLHGAEAADAGIVITKWSIYR